MNFGRTFLVVSFLCLFLSSWGWAKPTALIISVNDGFAVLREDAQLLEQLFAKFQPQTQVLRIDVHRSYLDTNNEHPRKEVIHKLDELISSGKLNSESSITHLVFNTHGSVETDDLGNRWTSLTALGKFGENDTSKELKALISMIRPFMHKKATVVLDACSTLSGAQEAAAFRATQLMWELGVTEGQLYGAIESELSISMTGPGKFIPLKNRLIPYRFHMAVFGVVMPILAGSMTSVMNHMFSFMLPSLHGAGLGIQPLDMTIGAFLVMGGMTTFMIMKERLTPYLGKDSSPKGLLLKFENGRPNLIATTTKYKDFERIYNFFAAPCPEAIANL